MHKSGGILIIFISAILINFAIFNTIPFGYAENNQTIPASNQTIPANNQTIPANNQTSPVASQNNNQTNQEASPITENQSNEDEIGVVSVSTTRSDYQGLNQKAQANGFVRIIVGLDAPFEPEGNFATIQEKINQRENIVNAQDALLQAIPSP